MGAVGLGPGFPPPCPKQPTAQQCLPKFPVFVEKLKSLGENKRYRLGGRRLEAGGRGQGRGSSSEDVKAAGALPLALQGPGIFHLPASWNRGLLPEPVG